MRKPIRYAVAAFTAWAVITFAWAAFSHVTGFVGPARASAASLDFVANAMELTDPPGVLGAPQRFAANRVRRAARSAERLHRGPERVMARLVDRLGHDRAHGRRNRHRHGRDPHVVIDLDQLDQAAERFRQVSIIELKRHRARAPRSPESARRQADRARRTAQRAMERTELRFNEQGRMAEELQAVMSQLDASLAGIDTEFSGISDDRKEELKRRIEEKIREIIERLGDRMEEVSVEVTSESEGLVIDLDGAEGVETVSPVRIRVRRR